MSLGKRCVGEQEMKNKDEKIQLESVEVITAYKTLVSRTIKVVEGTRAEISIKVWNIDQESQ